MVASSRCTLIVTVRTVGGFQMSFAENVAVYVPAGAATAPETEPVPSPWSTSESPAGRPLTLSVIGSPSGSADEMLKLNGSLYCTESAPGTTSVGGEPGGMTTTS